MLFELNKYLPPMLGKLKDLQQINEVGSMELRKVYLSMQRLQNNFSVEKCDEETISQWEEEILNTYDNENTLEIRRQNVLIQLNSFAPYTLETLKSKLNTILTIEGYYLNIDYANQTYMILVYQLQGITNKTVDFIKKLAIMMIPSHLQGTITLGSMIESYYTQYIATAIVQADIYEVNFE